MQVLVPVDNSVFLTKFTGGEADVLFIPHCSKPRKVSSKATRRHHKTKILTINKKILKINRHLFNYGTSKLNRVLRSFVPRVVGSTPTPYTRIAQLVEQQAFNLLKKRVKNRAEMIKLKLSLQGKGYRLDKLFSLNLTSLYFGVLHFFHLDTIKSIEK